jgi:hypothetical protein
MMMQFTKPGVITEQEARQLEQSLQDTRSGMLCAFSVMMQADGDIQEELKHDPLYVSDSLAELREALNPHRQVADLIETAVNRLEGMLGATTSGSKQPSTLVQKSPIHEFLRKARGVQRGPRLKKIADHVELYGRFGIWEAKLNGKKKFARIELAKELGRCIGDEDSVERSMRQTLKSAEKVIHGELGCSWWMRWMDDSFHGCWFVLFGGGFNPSLASQYHYQFVETRVPFEIRAQPQYWYLVYKLDHLESEPDAQHPSKMAKETIKIEVIRCRPFRLPEEVLKDMNLVSVN